VARFLRWRSVASLVLQLAVLSLLVAAFFMRLPEVSGRSMEPLIHSGEYVLINTFAFRFGRPRRGEIVAFRHEGDAREVFIKRVIGLPGDRIRIDRGRVYVNGAKQDEPYVQDAGRPQPSRNYGAPSLGLRFGRQSRQQRRFARIRSGERRPFDRPSRRRPLASEHHGRALTRPENVREL